MHEIQQTLLRRRFRFGNVLLLILSIMAFCSAGYGQQTTATIIGNVTDSTGASVVGATVKATNSANSASASSARPLMTAANARACPTVIRSVNDDVSG